MISKFIRQCGYYTWISFTTTWGPIQWRPWYLLHTSTTYGESLSRWRWVFFLMVFSGWNPTYLRTDSYVHNILHITHITYTMRNWWTSLRKKGVLWLSSTYWYVLYRFSAYWVRICTICTTGTVCTTGRLPVTHSPMLHFHASSNISYSPHICIS